MAKKLYYAQMIIKIIQIILNVYVIVYILRLWKNKKA